MKWFHPLTFAVITALATPARAQDEEPDQADAGVPALSDLPELPKLTPIEEAAPDPEAVAWLDDLLSRLIDDDARTRELAVEAIAKTQPSAVAAIYRRTQEIRKTLDRDKAPIFLDNARKAAREAKKEEDGEGSETWLSFTLAQSHEDPSWRDLVRLLAMTEMLAAVGDTPACRLLIEYRAYFGDMLRIDLERKLTNLKDRAVPALIEARKHDAQVVPQMANKLLDRMGRAIPGEAVASSDPQILADVMRAFGRTRDVDATRVVLTFCNHERAQVRNAAREALTAIGEPAKWQLRDAYLGLTGEKPPRSHSWQRMAREIFGIYDALRLAEILRMMEQGQAAIKAEDYPKAVEAFDQVLARDPLFEKRQEMVAAYVELGRSKVDEQPKEALRLLRKAKQLRPEEPPERDVESLIAYLEAKSLMDDGVVDRFLLDRALELDPRNERARALLDSLDEKTVAKKESNQRYAYAGGVFVFALMALVLLWRRKPKDQTPEPRIPPPPSQRADPNPSPVDAPAPAPVGPEPSVDETKEAAPSNDGPASSEQTP